MGRKNRRLEFDTSLPTNLIVRTAPECSWGGVSFLTEDDAWEEIFRQDASTNYYAYPCGIHWHIAEAESNYYDEVYQD